jgi:hypothetical protein
MELFGTHWPPGTAYKTRMNAKERWMPSLLQMQSTNTYYTFDQPTAYVQLSQHNHDTCSTPRHVRQLTAQLTFITWRTHKDIATMS